MRNSNKSDIKNQITKTEYLISFLLIEFRKSVKFFLQTKRGVSILISVLKFSTPSQKSYLFSLLGFFIPKLTRFNQGPFLVGKLTNYLGTREKIIMIKILTKFFSKFLFSTHQIRIFDLIYQCFFSKGEKFGTQVV